MNANEWLTAYAEKLGSQPPTADEIKTILDLAGEAAHASERIAAPVFSRSKRPLLPSSETVLTPSPFRSSTRGLVTSAGSTVTVNGTDWLAVSAVTASVARALTTRLNVPVKPCGAVMERLSRFQLVTSAVVMNGKIGGRS